jgi:hypothetical protein
MGGRQFEVSVKYPCNIVELKRSPARSLFLPGYGMVFRGRIFGGRRSGASVLSAE